MLNKQKAAPNGVASIPMEPANSLVCLINLFIKSSEDFSIELQLFRSSESSLGDCIDSLNQDEAEWEIKVLSERRRKLFLLRNELDRTGKLLATKMQDDGLDPKLVDDTVWAAWQDNQRFQSEWFECYGMLRSILRLVDSENRDIVRDSSPAIVEQVVAHEDGLYEDEKCLIWGGVRYERLTPKMIRILGVFVVQFEKGFPIVDLSMIRQQTKIDFDGSFVRQAFKQNRNGEPPVHPVVNVIEKVADGEYRLSEPSGVLKIPE